MKGNRNEEERLFSSYLDEKSKKLVVEKFPVGWFSPLAFKTVPKKKHNPKKQGSNYMTPTQTSCTIIIWGKTLKITIALFCLIPLKSGQARQKKNRARRRGSMFFFQRSRPSRWGNSKSWVVISEKPGKCQGKKCYFFWRQIKSMWFIYIHTIYIIYETKYHHVNIYIYLTHPNTSWGSVWLDPPKMPSKHCENLRRYLPACLGICVYMPWTFKITTSARNPIRFSDEQ